MKRQLALVMAVGAVAWGSVAEGVPPGFDAASFARLGVGPRALAMGGAYVALAEGPASVYWNPAGLASLTDFQTEGTYLDLFGAGIYLQHVGAAGYPLFAQGRPEVRIGGRRWVFGAGWLSVRVADIPWWEEDGTQGVFDAWSHILLLAVAWPVSEAPYVALGLTGKVYHDRILAGSSFGLGADVGLVWRTAVADVPVTIGVCAVDLGGTRVQWSGTTGNPVNHVPWLMRVGAAGSLWEGQLSVAVSYEWGVDRPRFERVRLGGEARLEWLSLRAGWDYPLFDAAGRWSAGLGISPLPWLTLDYAFLPGELGDSHLIGLKLAF